MRISRTSKLVVSHSSKTGFRLGMLHTNVSSYTFFQHSFIFKKPLPTLVVGEEGFVRDDRGRRHILPPASQPTPTYQGKAALSHYASM